MATGQKLSLRAYSFSIKPYYSKGFIKSYPLNSELKLRRHIDGEWQECSFFSAMDLVKEFINGNSIVDDKEETKQLFYCRFDPANQGETDTYTYLIFSAFAGYYGYASSLIDRGTKQMTHKKSRDEADVKEFYVMVAIPKDSPIQKAKRGLIFFQEIGVYGVKTITINTMQSFFSSRYNISFKAQNLAPDFYLKKLFESGVIQHIKIARNSISSDNSDRLYTAGYGREERILTPFKITRKLKHQLMHISKSKYSFFTFDNNDYHDVKMVVKIGDRVRTINLHALDELSVEEALPDELLGADGTIFFQDFKEHILIVATEYLQHLPHDV